NAAPVHGPVPNHLAWSIISTVLATCLCCPLGLVGIVAIVFSSKVNTLLNQGDIEGARRASANAKTWCWVTTALAIIGLLWSIYFFTSGGMAEYQQMMEQMQGCSMALSRPLRIAMLASAALAAGAGFWLLRTYDPNVAGNPFPPCMFRAFTGWFCIGCGLTRAMHALVHGDLPRAFAMNPL